MEQLVAVVLAVYFSGWLLATVLVARFTDRDRSDVQAFAMFWPVMGLDYLGRLLRKRAQARKPVAKDGINDEL